MRGRQSPSGVIVPGLNLRTLVLTPAQLNLAALTQTLNIGATLLAGKQFAVLQIGCNVGTDFSGGGSSAVTVAVGVTGDPNAVGTFDLFTGAPVNNQAPLTVGIAPGLFLTVGEQLQALVTSDVNVNLLTAGALTLSVVIAQLT